MDSGLMVQLQKILGIGKEGAWGCDESEPNAATPGLQQQDRCKCSEELKMCSRMIVKGANTKARQV